ncbi:hypothetical protein [Dyadobacter crusticola]|uniref:hypothetical protein n=1 Tax=Dyadobacter crusticola TaxID=292407 RepID=UPI0004E26D07|nr:hypothetical protein [Dyadobacter crusticola]
MDKDTLVERLKTIFRNKRKDGLYIDAIGLAPAYYGLIKDSYTLGVSAPSLKGKIFADKAAVIIDIMFENLTSDERGLIDRVRVFDTVDELNEHRDRDFETWYDEDYQYDPRKKIAELHEIA